MASSPQRLMVAAENFSAAPSRAKICPAMTSWMIRAKGMTVMAVFSLVTTEEMRRARASDPRRIRKKVIKSSMTGEVMMPSLMKWFRFTNHTIRVTGMVSARQRQAS